MKREYRQRSSAVGIKQGRFSATEIRQACFVSGACATNFAVVPDRPSVPGIAVRVDTNIEVEYYRHGGILPYVLRQIVQGH